MAPKDAAALMCQFFEQVKKRNGKLYPSQTLMSLLRAFNRVLRKKQEARIVETRVEEAPFNMKTNAVFKGVCIACVLAMRRSQRSGANVKRKKSKVITVMDEKTLLAHGSMQPHFAKGLQRRVAYYCLFRFAIRRGQELHNIEQGDFTIGDNERGQFVRYHERGSKAKKATLIAYQEEHFRQALYCYDPDVVGTFGKYLKRLPSATECKAIFCASIDNPHFARWFKTNVVGVLLLKTLVKDLNAELGLTGDAQNDEKGITSNKSGRTTMVSCMFEAGVPEEIGIQCTGHKSVGAYRRYDRSSEIKVRAAMRSAAGEGYTYEEALEDERRIMKGIIAGKTDADDDSPSKKMKLMTLENGSCSGEGTMQKDNGKSIQAKELKSDLVEEVKEKNCEPILETVSTVVENNVVDCATGADSVGRGGRKSGGSIAKEADLRVMESVTFKSGSLGRITCW